MKVSVVMAVYNGEQFLQEALDSILSQDYDNFEVIIVNDGSTDGTKTILEATQDVRVKVIHLPQNTGGANALNTGIREAEGTWIAIQDADDISYPTRISEQVKYITKNPKLIGVGTLVEYISSSPDVSNSFIERLTKRKNSIFTKEKLKKNRFYICDLTHSSMLFSKDMFWKVGGYNPEFKILYDYDLWLRLMEKGDIEKVPKVLLKYRLCLNSLSHQSKIKTANEIQLASSKGIYRLLQQNKDYAPRVAVLGFKNSCENYRDLIAPLSGLKVNQLIYKNFKKQIPRAIKDIKKGKLDAIVVLRSNKKIWRKLIEGGLIPNKEIFRIYNILR